MEPFRRVEGIVCPLDRSDVDTDQIIPKQFLKRIERTGFGEFLFWDWRGEEGFPLDRPEYAGASILVTGRNFGCGSSREHAPWALEDFGFRAVIAPSFADIFQNNCTKIGMVPVVLPEEDVREIMREATDNPGVSGAVDLERQVVRTPGGREVPFDFDPIVRERLLNGWDDIALTLTHQDEIARYEAEREHTGPVTTDLSKLPGA
jgi:3-isopropylmalate/(R)-2-methylmalate dehydratase small subunit